ncbi:hypothetical protein HA402_003031 [Bradysia odoriphaga]|nr:hypothetical protein HA402_003031 [Bradysia odoriphaga]
MFYKAFFILTILTVVSIHCAPLIDTSETTNINFRLPNNTVPEHYNISLRTWIHEGNFTFTGILSVDVRPTEPTDFITIHQDGFVIGDIRLSSEDGLIPIEPFEYNSTLDFLTIPTSVNLNPRQRYSLRIEYTGTLRDDDLGFYRSSYVNDSGATVWLAATQFQTGSARRAFPCYDEPGLKATIQVDITHDPSYEALSNMPDTSRVENADGSVTTFFETSPPISTYLVAFVVSNFPHLPGNTSRPILQRVYARPTAMNQTDLIFQISEPMLDNMIDYFGVGYPLPKLDSIALPDFRYGAMENWGLITYLEVLFLFDENTSTYADKMGVVSAVAHEYGHQWFGNLVSPSWWTYMWLNEGFTSYFQNKAMDMVFPNWNTIDYFTVRTLQDTFRNDALETSPPMNMYIEHHDLVTGLFSQMTSAKAACIVQMFLHAFTESTFLKGLQLYLNDRAFSIASEEDVFRFMEIAVDEDSSVPDDIDVPTVMFSWTSQAGFPLIEVTRNYDSEIGARTVRLSQERYYSDQSNSPNNITFWIPVNYATTDNPSSDVTTPDLWFPPTRDLEFTIPSLSASDWLLLNKQASGYYRVLYDDTNYEQLADAMVRNISLFHRLNRAQIIDDAYNFARIDRLTYAQFLNIVRFLENDNEYASWYPANTAFTTIDRAFSGHEDYPLLAEFIRSLIEHLYDTVGPRDIPDEPLLRKYSRPLAIQWACNLGSVHCRSDATRELRELMVTGGEFHQNVRSVLYCAALRSGNSNDFYFVWDRMLSTDDASGRNLLSSALGCSTTRRLLTELLRSTVEATNDNDIEYRPGEAYRVFSSVYQNGLLGLEMALDFLVQNTQEVFDDFGFANFENVIIGMSQRVSLSMRNRFTDLLNAVYDERLIADHIPFYANLYMDNNKDWLDRYGEDVSIWLRQLR